MSKTIIVLLMIMTPSLLLIGCQKGEQEKLAAQTESRAQRAAAGSPSAKAPPQASPFSSSLPAAIAGMAIADGGLCNIEVINGLPVEKVTRLERRDGLVMRGWAVDDAVGSAPSTVLFELAVASRSDRFYLAGKRGKRTDVAKRLQSSAYELSGCEATGELRSIPSGRYRVSILQARGDRLVRCHTGKDLEIR